MQQEQIQALRASLRSLRGLLSQSSNIRLEIGEFEDQQQNQQNQRLRAGAATTAAAQKRQLQEKLDSVEGKIIYSLSLNDNNNNNQQQQQTNTPLVTALLQASPSTMNSFVLREQEQQQQNQQNTTASSNSNNNSNNNESLSSVLIDLLLHENSDIVVCTCNTILTLSAEIGNDNNNNNVEDCPYYRLLTQLQNRGAWDSLIASLQNLLRNRVKNVAQSCFSKNKKDDENEKEFQNFTRHLSFFTSQESEMIDAVFKIFSSLVFTNQQVEPHLVLSVLLCACDVLERKSMHFLNPEWNRRLLKKQQRSEQQQQQQQQLLGDQFLVLREFLLNNKKKQEKESKNSNEFLLSSIAFFSFKDENPIASTLEVIFVILENFPISQLLLVNNNTASSSSSSSSSFSSVLIERILRALFSPVRAALELFMFSPPAEQKDDQEQEQDDEGFSVRYFDPDSSSLTSSTETETPTNVIKASPLEVTCIDSVLTDSFACLRILFSEFARSNNNNNNNNEKNEENNNKSILFAQALGQVVISAPDDDEEEEEESEVENSSDNILVSTIAKALRSFTMQPDFIPLWFSINNLVVTGEDREEDENDDDDDEAPPEKKKCTEIQKACIQLLELCSVAFSSSSPQVEFLLDDFSSLLVANGFLGIMTPIVNQFRLIEGIARRNRSSAERDENEDENENEPEEETEEEKQNLVQNSENDEKALQLGKFADVLVALFKNTSDKKSENNASKTAAATTTTTGARIAAKFSSSDILSKTRQILRNHLDSIVKRKRQLLLLKQQEHQQQEQSAEEEKEEALEQIASACRRRIAEIDHLLDI